jgi:uncharacterized protein YndB with AHSA1/START domain
MATTTATIEIPAPAAHVWQLVGGFDSLPDWLPYITASTLSEGGRVRTLTNEEGAVVVERLETFDNEARTYSYSILQAPFPVTGYRSTLTVHEVSGEQSRVEWSGTFTPAGASEEEVINLFHGIYTEGLAALKKTLGTGD